jgi:ribosomal protein L18E
MSSSFTKSQYLVSLDDQRFFSVTNIIQFLDILSSHEKYQTQKSVVDQLFFRRHAIEEELVFFLDYVVSDQIWFSKITLNQFIVEWQFFQKIARQIKRKRNKITKMKRIIETRWEFSNVFLMIDRSYHFLSSLRKLIEQYFWNKEVKRIIKVVTHRVMHSTSNRKFIIRIIVNDIIFALNSNLLVLSNEIMLRVARFFVREDQLVEVNKSMSFQISIDSLLLSLTDNSISFDDLLETSTFSFEAHNLRSIHDVLEFSLNVMKNSSSELFEMFETFEKTVETRKDFTTRRLKRCICSMNVFDAWKKNVREEKRLTIERCLILLEQTHTFDKLCYYHMRWLISNLDLMTNQLNEDNLRQRLHFINVNRLRIDNLKMNIATYNWFRKNHRFARLTNVLRSYRFFHQDWSKFVFDTAAIQIDLSSQQRREWFETDNLMLSRFFDWEFDQKISMFECSKHNIEKIVLKEFEMYKHHLRRINQRENNDWLRNMFYFIDQQLMRQNSLYYRWYVRLRFDKCWKLISYSYYEKYVMKKNSIFFRHIDQNISQLISFERDVNMIQDILSLNDEDISNCIVILFDMHHHLSFWRKRVIRRDLTSNNYIHQITD